MKRIPKRFWTQESFNNIKEQLRISQGARNFRKVRRNITTIDHTLVCITRFVYNVGDTKMYGAWEPETGFFETSKKPIGKIA